MKLVWAVVIGLVLAAVIIPFLATFGLLGGSMLGMALDEFLLVFLAVVVAGAIVIHAVWSRFTRPQQFFLVVLILALGVLTFQPEIDIVALIGAVYTVSGESRR